MRIVILGIGGTFMAGLATMAQSAGHQVIGFDNPLYPPMSDLLQNANIPVLPLDDPEQLWASSPDLVLVGNVFSRGHPFIEALMNSQIPFTSAPQWLASTLLKDKTVLAVTGTHGKTTTSSMLAWCLEKAGLNPGFLIGGIPENFGYSARLTDSPYFVIEADEYDTAFFDKRPKFLHLFPKVLLVNPIEHDHVDIYPDLQSIERQFQLLLRNVPSEGALIVNPKTPASQRLVANNQLLPVETIGPKGDWQYQSALKGWTASKNGTDLTTIDWSILGHHNKENALMVMAACEKCGLTPEEVKPGLESFKSVKRRYEVVAQKAGTVFVDDFAHHPSAIEVTVEGLRDFYPEKSVVAIVDLGTRSMQQGAYQLEQWVSALDKADKVFFHASRELNWSLSELIAKLPGECHVVSNDEQLLETLPSQLKGNEVVCMMSNTRFNQALRSLAKAVSAETVN